jgi:(2Fe-2S) ferredoxin
MAVKNYILVCGGTACESSKAEEIYQALIHEAEKQGVARDVQVVKTGCFGFCEKGPIVKVLPEEAFYVTVQPSDAQEIIAETIVKGRMVKRLLYLEEGKKEFDIEDIEFYQKQFRIVLRNCGVIDPEKIDEYIARDGYKALEKVLFEMKPADVIEEMKNPACAAAAAPVSRHGIEMELRQGRPAGGQKYVVCNADEGDPGAYMDRSTLEGDPHSVLEAMTIAGYTIGASKGYIYIRAEYPLAIERFEIAIRQSRDLRAFWAKHPGKRLLFDHRDSPRGGGLCLRRRDRAAGLHRRQARHAHAPSALPRRKGALGNGPR